MKTPEIHTKYKAEQGQFDSEDNEISLTVHADFR